MSHFDLGKWENSDGFDICNGVWWKSSFRKPGE